MFVNAGYLNHRTSDFVDTSRPLVVGSCGEYRLETQPFFATTRPEGRVDYQMLYVASGKAYFLVENEVKTVTAGQMVIYYPQEAQDYHYYLSDDPEVFWVHFTGSDVETILNDLGLKQIGHIFTTGMHPEFKPLFRQMILELQLSKPYFEENLSTLIHHFLILVARCATSPDPVLDTSEEWVSDAVRYFNANFNRKISIEEYAKNLHVSTAWFIHVFRMYTGKTPIQYLLSLRTTNAKSLLSQTNYSVAQISAIVGFENPFYFSRAFKKSVGLSPQQYRSSKK